LQKSGDPEQSLSIPVIGIDLTVGLCLNCSTACGLISGTLREPRYAIQKTS